MLVRLNKAIILCKNKIFFLFSQIKLNDNRFLRAIYRIINIFIPNGPSELDLRR